MEEASGWSQIENLNGGFMMKKMLIVLLMAGFVQFGQVSAFDLGDWVDEAITTTIISPIAFVTAVVETGLPIIGNYAETCTKISLDGSTLSATCPNTSGVLVSTKLTNALGCGSVENKNGKLTCISTSK